jgi:hypothetical protein
MGRAAGMGGSRPSQETSPKSHLFSAMALSEKFLIVIAPTSRAAGILLARWGRLRSGIRSREATAASADGVVGAASTQIYSEVEPPPRLLLFWMLRDILFMVASAPPGQKG